MSDAWLAFLVVFAMLLAIWRIADGRERPMTKSEQERMFFRQTYSLSIDRMLSESPLDRDEVRRLRDSGRSDGSAAQPPGAGPPRGPHAAHDVDWHLP